MDLLATVFLALALAAAGLPVEWLLLYAWNPLVIKAFAASGHSDAIAVTAIAALAYFLLKGAKFAAGASFALAVLAKLIPIVLFPFVARRIGWRNSILALLMILLGYLPFWMPGDRSSLALPPTRAFGNSILGHLRWLSGLPAPFARTPRATLDCSCSSRWPVLSHG